MGFKSLPVTDENMLPHLQVENECAYIDADAPGAMVRGTRIIKIFSDPDDGNPNGAEGYVMGSIGPADVPKYPGVRYFYWIRWDDRPDLIIGIMENKISRKEE